MLALLDRICECSENWNATACGDRNFPKQVMTVRIKKVMSSLSQVLQSGQRTASITQDLEELESALAALTELEKSNELLGDDRAVLHLGGGRWQGG